MTASLLVFSAPAQEEFAMIAEDHPGVGMEGTPMRETLLLRLTGDDAALEEVGQTVPSLLSPDRCLRGDGHLTVIIEMPKHLAGILSRADREGAYILPPLLWRDGRLRLRLLMFGRTGAASAILPGAELESKSVLQCREVESELMASGLLLPALTRRQGESMVAAVDAGYYDLPRKVTTAEMALGMGIARSTFEEHLRSAESQLVKALSPVVRMRLREKEEGMRAAGADALQLYARFSKDLGLYVNMTVRGDMVTKVDLTDAPPEQPHGEDHPYLSRILEHLSTGRGDLRGIPLDLEVTPFERRVLEALRTIPPGEVVTYG